MAAQALAAVWGVIAAAALSLPPQPERAAAVAQRGSHGGIHWIGYFMFVSWCFGRDGQSPTLGTSIVSR
jgi:hypothetical protein